MSGTRMNEVETFSQEGRVSVRLGPPWRADRVKAALGEMLGLKPASLPLFGVFEGSLDAPSSVLGEDSAVAAHTSLCLRRWNMDLSLEARLCRHDDVASHLLFREVQCQLESGGGGREMGASPETVRQLEELADPAFPAERQFLDLARSLPGYGALVAREVVVETDLVSNDVNIRRGQRVTCRLERERLVLTTAEGEEVCWGWELVKRWRTSSCRQLGYEVCVMQANAPLLCWLHLLTPQAYFLRAGSEMICHYRHNDRTSPTAPRANPNMAGKPFNPLVDFLNSELFTSTRFSSVEK